MRNLTRLSIAAVLLVLTVCCSKQPVINIDGGAVQGVSSAVSGVTVFKGIPYAAPPVGDLRWREPQPVIPWEGVKVADTFGPIPWQEDLSKMDLYGKEFYADGMPEMSEDCLYLNIWAPSKAVSKGGKLPVALWIHGGAFKHGFSNEITFDGDAWAERGVILVTFNYREGVLGFLGHKFLAEEEGAELRSGNYALYDMVAALTWVRNNIAAFGGDPDNITVFGQSAGARSVQTLVSGPLTEGMIAKAIIQSGGGINPELQGREPYYEQVWDAGKAFCDYAGYTTLEQMRAASPQDIMHKYAEYEAEGNNIPIGPMVDMKMNGESFTTAASQNHIPDIPYMIGSTAGDGMQRANDIAEFCASRNYYEGKPVFDYLFTRRLPGDDAGAFHSAELWYMFGTLDRCWRPFTDGDRELSRQMLDAWTNFCKYGNPCGAEQTGFWLPYTEDNHFRKVFDVE
ncbi:MAG: carboxylesterase family protein [Bacteroidales bacterium]|nr:carboxylesterase family protein [Bacteroidales bacterium]